MELEREIGGGKGWGWRIAVPVLRLGDLEWMAAPADLGRMGDGATEPVVAVWVRAARLTGTGDSEASTVGEGEVGVWGVVSSMGSAAGVSARERRLVHSCVRKEVATFGGAGGRRDLRKGDDEDGGAVLDGSSFVCLSRGE